jgi:hypothetical protein
MEASKVLFLSSEKLTVVLKIGVLEIVLQKDENVKRTGEG